jgi:non-specific serine/threonine protein kinase
VTFGLQAAPVDGEIELKIAEMVASNHEAIAADAARPGDRRAPARAIDHEAEKRAKEREYWAILNEDPAQLLSAAKAEAAEASPDSGPETEPAPRRARRFSLSGLLPWSGRGARQSMQSNA